MKPAANPKDESDQKLKGFDDYDDYQRYIQSLFEMDPDECATLFQVLLKLQSVGQNPIDILHQCKYRQGDRDCLEMLKFMMYINDLDLSKIGTE